MRFYKYGGLAMPLDDAVEWGHRLDPHLQEKERALQERCRDWQPPIDTDELTCATRVRHMAMDAAEKYVKDRKASIRIVLHPITGAEYFMVITRAAYQPSNGSLKPNFTSFTPCKKDGTVRTLLEEQGVKNVEYLTALSRY
jgi:hypothetical protein